jgi:hypothetical protein
MTSATSAAEAAIYGALTAGVTLATTYQHVPEDTPPPVVIIGDLEASQFDTKDDRDREISVAITSVVQGEARKPVMDIQEQIAAALNHKTFSESGWTLHTWIEDESAILLPDAITYLGTTRVKVMAFA